MNNNRYLLLLSSMVFALMIHAYPIQKSENGWGDSRTADESERVKGNLFDIALDVKEERQQGHSYGHGRRM